MITLFEDTKHYRLSNGRYASKQQKLAEKANKRLIYVNYMLSVMRGQYLIRQMANKAMKKDFTGYTDKQGNEIYVNQQFVTNKGNKGKVIETINTYSLFIEHGKPVIKLNSTNSKQITVCQK